MEGRLRGSSSDGSIGLLDNGKAAVLLNITTCNHTSRESDFKAILSFKEKCHCFHHRHRHRVIQASLFEISGP